jgi:signal transduction histidine kinase
MSTLIAKKFPHGKVVWITVSDTGIGVPAEEIPYLFRKFSRGKDVSRLHVGGTGLGLFVGKAIAEAHHGQTWLESDGAGKGSRFIIEIPLDDGEKKEKEKEREQRMGSLLEQV